MFEARLSLLTVPKMSRLGSIPASKGHMNIVVVASRYAWTETMFRPESPKFLEPINLKGGIHLVINADIE